MKKILVVSHERSGTHFLINTIALNFPEYDWNVHSFVGSPNDVRKQFLDFDGKEEKRIFKSHHAIHFLEPLKDYFSEEWVVFHMYRNVWDVMVSSWLYHQKANNPSFPNIKTLSEWLRVDPRDWGFDGVYSDGLSSSMPERWGRMVLGWGHNDIATTITYEELKNNPHGVIEVVASCLGVSSHENKKVATIKGTPSVAPRKGEIGDHYNHMSNDDYMFTSINAIRGMANL